MVISLKRSYPKLENGVRKLDSKGNPIIVFVYQVTGTDEELKRYEQIQLKNEVKTIKDDSGYLYFTTNPVGMKGVLKVSTNNKLFVDTTAIDLANAVAKNYGAVGRMIAKDILEKGVVTDETVADEVPDLDKI